MNFDFGKISSEVCSNIKEIDLYMEDCKFDVNSIEREMLHYEIDDLVNTQPKPENKEEFNFQHAAAVLNTFNDVPGWFGKSKKTKPLTKHISIDKIVSNSSSKLIHASDVGDPKVSTAEEVNKRIAKGSESLDVEHGEGSSSTLNETVRLVKVKKFKPIINQSSSDNTVNNSSLKLTHSDSVTQPLPTADEIFQKYSMVCSQLEELKSKGIPTLAKNIQRYVAEVGHLQKLVEDMKRLCPKVNERVDAFTVEEKTKIEQLRKNVEAFIYILESNDIYTTKPAEPDEELETLSKIINDLAQNM